MRSLKGNQSEVEHVTFSVFYLIAVTHLKRYILLKTPPESVVPKLCAIEGFSQNRKQRKYIPSSGYISQSMLPTSD